MAWRHINFVQFIHLRGPFLAVSWSVVICTEPRFMILITFKHICLQYGWSPDDGWTVLFKIIQRHIHWHFFENFNLWGKEIRSEAINRISSLVLLTMLGIFSLFIVNGNTYTPKSRWILEKHPTHNGRKLVLNCYVLFINLMTCRFEI